ncbi:MAG: DUF4389 domain-containing protein [Acidimicrobiia bacterium]|nr:DUF4389 domain-containing protein [Acidimicrobiia bacterium]
MAYPVDVSIDYGDGERSRGLAVAGIIFPVKVLLALPHMIVLAFVQFGAFIASWIGYWAIAFSGNLPPGIARFVHNTLGWSIRVTAWLASMRDEYPAFALEQPEYPATVTITEPGLGRSRGLAVTGILWFVKALLLLPHLIVLEFVGIAAAIAGWIAYWAIAITGVYPDGIFNFVQGTLRWSTRTTAWLLGLTDEYPPFALK